jgi:serine/threonine protein phosphatase 1
MLTSLFRRGRQDQPTPKAEVPAGQRVYAIGDIHGRDDLFAKLIEQIVADEAERGAADTTIVLLGDLIDRGPRSAEVVERAWRLTRERKVQLLTANHEEVFLKALGGDVEALRFFCRIGGEETILSYGLSDAAYRGMDYVQLMEELQQRVPRHHSTYLASAENWVLIGDYLFVHAGIRPGVPFAEQRVEDLRWIREPFLSHRDPHSAMVIHGHTISEGIDKRSNRIGIDTGAFASGILTAIGLEANERWFLCTKQ